LGSFLASWQQAPEIESLDLHLEVLGEQSAFIREIVEQNIPVKTFCLNREAEVGGGAALLRFHAGAVTSRKALIAPYLPPLIS
jgi:hypothetical protein